MHGFTPVRWLWGLVPLLLVALLVVVGEGPRIERDLTQRSAAMLEEKGYGWAQLQFRGQDGVLTGIAWSPEERAEALALVSGVWGVRTVQDRAELLEVVSPYTWIATRKGNRIRVKGHVPSKTDRKTMLGIIKATMPELEIDDRTKLAGGSPPRQQWLAAVTFALNQLGQLKEGSARLSDLEFVLVGEASSLTSFNVVKNSLATQAPSWLTFGRLAVAPPDINPFDWTVQRKGSRVILSGHVPSDEARQLIIKYASNAFPDAIVVDKMVLGSGVPRNWIEAVQVALTHLARLEEGEIALTDTKFSIDAVATDKETAEGVLDKVRAALPDNFTAVDKVRVRKGANRVEWPDRQPELRAAAQMTQPGSGAVASPGRPVA